MKKIISIIIIVILFSPEIIKSQDLPQFIEVTSEVVIPKHYIVTKTNEEMIIDGLAKEASWQSAKFSDPFIDIVGVKAPTYETNVKMLWDDKYLYVYAQLQEPHIWGNLEERDAIIYLNNDFEIFIDPSGKGVNYFEIEINAMGTVWDLLLTKPYRVGGKAINYWNLNELESAVHIQGTINNPNDIDSYWTVEMAIPLNALTEPRIKPLKIPADGEQWRINFSRVEWDHEIIDGKYQRKRVNGKVEPEHNWVWCNQKAINMHQPERWGILQFTNEPSSINVTFIEDKNVLVKQAAFALFRQARFGTLKYLLNEKPGVSKKFRLRYSEEDTIDAIFYKTNLGFEFKILSPNTNKTLIINEEGVLKIRNSEGKRKFVFATWSNAGKEFDKEQWVKKIELYKELGISEILVGGNPEVLSQILPLAKNNNIKVHAWMWTLNRPDDTIANKHPEWYAVNRNGKNSLEYRAYVDYYQWLSPFHPDAREYIKNNVRKLLEVKGLASIHLDYVRYVDVILGEDLQPKYGLVQDHEMPEYDYDYHPIARKGFKALFGIDPLELENPELSTEWHQYRLNAITSLVNEIVDIAHKNGNKVTAAVFPFPEMSRQMVRQAWDDWKLDAAYPMLYNNFYRQNINWIGFATEQGIKDVGFPIIPGLYSAALKDPEDLEKAIRLAKEKGAQGISIFTADNLNENQKEVFKKLRKEFSIAE